MISHLFSDLEIRYLDPDRVSLGAQNFPLATTCLLAKLITQSFLNSAYHENEILYVCLQEVLSDLSG